jgi:hypothetical protein
MNLFIKLKSRLGRIKPIISTCDHTHADYGVCRQAGGVLLANPTSVLLSRSQSLNDSLRFQIFIDENSMVSNEHFVQHDLTDFSIKGTLTKQSEL